MPVVAFRCEHALPLWAVAAGAVAIGAPHRARPLLMTLLAVGAIASTLPAIVRRFGPARRRVEVLPACDDLSPAAGLVITAGTRTRTFDQAMTARMMKRDDTADLVRMDDDGGGWHEAPQPTLADGPVPRNQRQS
jgi:hypothetical protein